MIEPSREAFSLYRKRNEVYYEKEITQGRNFICFDILSVFYNLLDVFTCYSRFEKSILKDGKKVKPGELRKLRDDMLSDRTILMSKCPLYVEILDDIVKSESISVSEDGKYSYKEADTKLVYKVCLRNIDLLEQISYRLQRKRPDKSSDNIQLLKKMFDNLAEITISTYQNDKGIQADIKYRFLML